MGQMSIRPNVPDLFDLGQFELACGQCGERLEVLSSQDDAIRPVEGTGRWVVDEPDPAPGRNRHERRAEASKARRQERRLRKRPWLR